MSASVTRCLCPVRNIDQLNPYMLQVRKEYIKFGLAKWGLLFVERGLQIAVVPRVVGPTDSVYIPIVGHTFVYLISVKNPCAIAYMKKLKQPGLKQLLKKTLSRDLNPGRPD